jgi:hypothetical protein
MHGCEIGGPFINGSQFIVEFKMDATERASGKRSIMHETGLYTVEDGKIVDEKFFYTPS